jgi:hypothetical protein
VLKRRHRAHALGKPFGIKLHLRWLVDDNVAPPNLRLQRLNVLAQFAIRVEEVAADGTISPATIAPPTLARGATATATVTTAVTCITALTAAANTAAPATATDIATMAAIGADAHCIAPTRPPHSAVGTAAGIRNADTAPNGLAAKTRAPKRRGLTAMRLIINPNQRVPNKNLARFHRRYHPVVNAPL